jgi:hypothetical protein
MALSGERVPFSDGRARSNSLPYSVISDSVSDSEDSDEGSSDHEAGTLALAREYRHSSSDDRFTPFDINFDALRHVATYYLPGGHGRCTDVDGLTRGSSHEIYLLHFEDGWSCIGRCSNAMESLDKMESEVAAMQYVKKYTALAVPEIYFTNFNSEHAVGAAFALMERLPGEPLHTIWDDLGLAHKKVVLEQIADVVAQLAGLEFELIGILKTDGRICPLLDNTSNGPITKTFNTTEDYMLSYMPDPTTCTPEANSINNFLKDELVKTINSTPSRRILGPPYCLRHPDFDLQNMLFTFPSTIGPPKLSGIIDWDDSYTAPLYELLEYPIFIQDVHWNKELYTENKLLRKHFVRALANRFPKGSEMREAVKECFRMKCWVLQNFMEMWIEDGEDEIELDRGRIAVEKLNDGSALAYHGRLDWEADSEIESEDEGEGDE